MNVIIAYLDTMFAAYPHSPRLAEAKAELRTMMEDAYTSLIAQGSSENEAVGQVIRDFGNLDEVAPALGIAAQLRAEPSHAPATTAAALTPDEARAYFDHQLTRGRRIAAGVAMFVLSPITVILLPVASETGWLSITEEVASLLGLIALLILVATGVTLCVAASRTTSAAARVEEQDFVLTESVSAFIADFSSHRERARVRALQGAIALWILAVVPVAAFTLLTSDRDDNGAWAAVGVCVALAMVAGGLALLLGFTWARSAAQSLEAEAESSPTDSEAEGDDSIVGIITAIYWPLLTTIFLAWGFIWDGWDRAWIVWPIGSVLYAAIAAGTGAIESRRRSRTER